MSGPEYEMNLEDENNALRAQLAAVEAERGRALDFEKRERSLRKWEDGNVNILVARVARLEEVIRKLMERGRECINEWEHEDAKDGWHDWCDKASALLAGEGGR